MGTAVCNDCLSNSATAALQRNEAQGQLACSEREAACWARRAQLHRQPRLVSAAVNVQLLRCTACHCLYAACHAGQDAHLAQSPRLRGTAGRGSAAQSVSNRQLTACHALVKPSQCTTLASHCAASWVRRRRTGRAALIRHHPFLLRADVTHRTCTPWCCMQNAWTQTPHPCTHTHLCTPRRP